MKIEQLNSYLRNNIKNTPGDFLNPSPYFDEYDRFRRDADIYCYSSMWSITNQSSTSDEFINHIHRMVEQVVCNCSCEEHKENILRLALSAVRADGDDLCDEQSVGWYIGLHTYIHCLAFNTYDYQEIFLDSWKKYFSVNYQNAIRGIKNTNNTRITLEEVTDFLSSNEEHKLDIINLKYSLSMRVYSSSYFDNDDYENALCRQANTMYLQKQEKEYLLCLMVAISTLVFERTFEIYMPEGMCMIANKILSFNN